MLSGGYSVNSAFYAFFNNGMRMPNESGNVNTTLPDQNSINVSFEHAGDDANFATNGPTHHATDFAGNLTGTNTGSGAGNDAGSGAGNAPGVTRHAVFGDFNCLYPTSILVRVAFFCLYMKLYTSLYRSVRPSVCQPIAKKTQPSQIGAIRLFERCKQSITTP